jgi:hypothetical protein
LADKDTEPRDFRVMRIIFGVRGFEVVVGCLHIGAYGDLTQYDE